MKRTVERLALVLIYCALILVTHSPSTAQHLSSGDNAKLLAPTPPMGWNSWDSYGEGIAEDEVRANADWMAQHLKQFGWQYVVIDEGWYVRRTNQRTTVKARTALANVSADARNDCARRRGPAVAGFHQHL